MHYLLFALLIVTLSGCNEINLSGTISGLTSNGLVLGNGNETVSPLANANSFIFPSQLKAGDSYNVFVKAQPTGLFCSVSKGWGTIVKTAISDVTVTCVVAPSNGVSVTITSPVDGASVSGNTLNVTGTFMGPLNTGITVNGIVAAQDSNRFYAQVPLASGSNALTITATTPAGNTATQTVNLTSTGSSPFQVSANPGSGIAPLLASFTIQNNTLNAMTRIEADFNGDGVIDLTTNDPATPMQFTYASPGVYQSSFKVTDSQNNITSLSYLVVVQDHAQLDQLLKTQWSGMSNALVSGNKAQALSHMTLQAQTKYEPVFDALLPNMPAIIQTFSSPTTSQLSASLGEYAVKRNRADGQVNMYLIYFLVDPDGVWKLDSM